MEIFSLRSLLSFRPFVLLRILVFLVNIDIVSSHFRIPLSREYFNGYPYFYINIFSEEKTKEEFSISLNLQINIVNNLTLIYSSDCITNENIKRNYIYDNSKNFAFNFNSEKQNFSFQLTELEGFYANDLFKFSDSLSFNNLSFILVTAFDMLNPFTQNGIISLFSIRDLILISNQKKYSMNYSNEFFIVIDIQKEEDLSMNKTGDKILFYNYNSSSKISNSFAFQKYSIFNNSITTNALNATINNHIFTTEFNLSIDFTSPFSSIPLQHLQSILENGLNITNCFISEFNLFTCEITKSKFYELLNNHPRIYCKLNLLNSSVSINILKQMNLYWVKPSSTSISFFVSFPIIIPSINQGRWIVGTYHFEDFYISLDIQKSLIGFLVKPPNIVLEDEYAKTNYFIYLVLISIIAICVLVLWILRRLSKAKKLSFQVTQELIAKLYPGNRNPDN